MVFCGKLSTGCDSCRRKKKKCDGVKPACGQCSRTHTICPGYRDLTRLAFRDESDYVVRKANKIQIGSIVARQSCLQIECVESVDRGQSSITSRNQNGVIIPRGISSSIEEHATCFFFKTHVTANSPYSRGHLTFLPLMYSQVQDDSALCRVIKSIGTAGLSIVTGNPQLMITARKSYVTAIHLTNIALSSHEKITNDQILMAVLLLGLYETIICSSAESVRSWESHIKGALTLLELRGEKQLKCDTGLQMFLDLRTQILVSCLQREAAVPDIITEWSSKALKYHTEVVYPEDTLTLIAGRLCAVKGRGDKDPIASIHSLFSITDDLAQWVENLPEAYGYTAVTAELNHEVLSGYYHIYQEESLIEVWNKYRCIAILTNELILDHLRAHTVSLNDNSDQFPVSIKQELESNILKLSSDICATVPSLVGFYNKSQTPPKNTSAASDKLIWPLYVAASMNSTSDRIRDWVAAQLAQIGPISGTKQAQMLAMMLHQKEDIVSWRMKCTGLGEATILCQS